VPAGSCHSRASRGLRPVLEQLGGPRLPVPENAEVPSWEQGRQGRIKRASPGWAGSGRDWQGLCEPADQAQAHRLGACWGPAKPPQPEGWNRAVSVITGETW